jgi:hypothetical protein
VKIAASNYGTNEQPGILLGYTPTTPEQCQVTIVDGNILTCDFGYDLPGAVGDRVWSDFNGNGVQDPGEPGIDGIPMSLYDASNNLIASDTTHGDGNYMIGGVPAGTYTVRIDDTFLPGGLTPTYDLDGVATPNAAVVTVAGGQIRTDVDFGYQGTASVGDRVWLDTNGNGVQDAGEAGLNGVTVQLLDGAGNVLASATTSGDGNYSFSRLNGGNYSVRIVAASLPPGVTETYDLDGVATTNVAAFSLNPGDSRTDLDFGYRGRASVGDRVWLDANGNGVQDAGETGINGATVQLINSSSNILGVAKTTGDGNYTFNNLSPGTYTVRVASLPAGVSETYDLDGLASANQAAFALAAGQNRTDVDFGYRNTGSVGDRVWLDANGNGVQDTGEAGITGVTVQLLQGNAVLATTSTGADGHYLFANLAAGSYSIRGSGGLPSSGPRLG